MKWFPPACSLIAALGLPVSAWADTVAEWKFDGGEASPGEIVKLDVAAANASSDSKLMERSLVRAEETGLGDKWGEALRKGYLESPASGGTNAPNQAGLKTEGASEESKNAGYKNYMGFSGLGTAEKGTGGTVYLVVKPNEGWQKQVKRRAFFGTGHTLEGVVRLGLTEQKALTFSVGGTSSNGRNDAATVSLEFPWDLDKWYFLAASWQEGVAPIIYVREMAAEGPKASPAAKSAQSEAVAPSGTDSPKTDPLVIGASWFNPGGGAAVIDGADGQIAYARVDNVCSSESEIEAVFNALGTP